LEKEAEKAVIAKIPIEVDPNGRVLIPKAIRKLVNIPPRLELRLVKADSNEWFIILNPMKEG